MTLSRFRIRAAARRDLEAYGDHLAAKAGVDVAQRFIDSGQRSFAAIATATGLGPSAATRDIRLAGLRKWRVDGFPKILIFYIPEKSAVRIVRVLHSAQDWTTLFDAD